MRLPQVAHDIPAASADVTRQILGTCPSNRAAKKTLPMLPGFMQGLDRLKRPTS